jgi:hypothetical protein
MKQLQIENFEEQYSQKLAELEKIEDNNPINTFIADYFNNLVKKQKNYDLVKRSVLFKDKIKSSEIFLCDIGGWAIFTDKCFRVFLGSNAHDLPDIDIKYSELNNVSFYEKKQKLFKTIPAGMRIKSYHNDNNGFHVAIPDDYFNFIKTLFANLKLGIEESISQHQVRLNTVNKEFTLLESSLIEKLLEVVNKNLDPDENGTIDILDNNQFNLLLQNKHNEISINALKIWLTYPYTILFI